VSALRVIVHVGLAKAGSTALQAALAGARGGALAASGAAYPAIGGGGVKDQRPLPAAIAARPDPEARRAVLAALGTARESGARTVVLSGETLHEEDPARLRALLEESAFAGARLEAVAVVRDAATWLNSRYAFRAVLFRERGGFAPAAGAAIRRGEADPLARLGRWMGAPVDALAAVPLRARDDPRGIAVRAAEAMGLDLAAAGSGDGPRNAAPDPRTVEAAIRLCARGLAGADRRTARIARARLEKAAAANGWRERFCGLDSALAAGIAARTDAAFDAFARRVWGRPWDAVYDVPDPASFASNEWRRGRPDGDAIAAAVERVAEAMALGRPGVLGSIRAGLARIAP
jgi:hypothetical protein